MEVALAGFRETSSANGRAGSIVLWQDWTSAPSLNHAQAPEKIEVCALLNCRFQNLWGEVGA